MEVRCSSGAMHSPSDHGDGLDGCQTSDLVLESVEEDWETGVELSAQPITHVADYLSPVTQHKS